MFPDESPGGAAPRWERNHPGRFRWELDALRKAGVVPVPDHEALAKGVLVLDITWPLGGREVPLRAVYPDSFPHLRPTVRLLGDPTGFPARHCSPDGELCLLGRDSAQWPASMTLADLLGEQLAHAMNATGDEDPQGEPAEVWWNTLGIEGSYCLVDSAWTLGDCRSGMLKVRYKASDVDGQPVLNLAVVEARDSQGHVLATSASVLPRSLNQTAMVPWIRVAGSELPAGDINSVNVLFEGSEFLRKRRAVVGMGSYQIGLFCIIYDAELQWRRQGIGWLFSTVYTRASTRRGNASRSSGATLAISRTFRAGPADLGARVPGVALLREKRVGIIGAGAVGGPVAVELARNGCKRLHVVEHDLVEPGTSIRWPLGVSAWGARKPRAISGFVEDEYPWTEVVRHEHRIGSGDEDGTQGDEAVLSAVLGDVDLVIDGTASNGVTTLLAERCRGRGIPLIELHATPTVQGGIVARYAPAGGCPICLQYAWHRCEIPKPPGFGDDAGLQQPPGCAERTFTGASYDLLELSLQAVRLAVETLQRPDAERHSVVNTLSLVDDSGRSVPPRWRVDPLPPHAECTCWRRR